MSAFDKLQNYSARDRFENQNNESKTEVSSQVQCDEDLFDSVDSKLFDKKSPTGYFLRAIHKNGYKVIENVYISKDGSKINEDRYLALPDSEKDLYTCKLVKSELCEALTTSGDQLIISSAGSGKALENSTLVRTSKGDKPIGKLTLEDEVIGSDLKPHKIIGIFPQPEKKRAYQITTGDGSKLKSCGEHLWTLMSGRTLTTKELFNERYSAECDTPRITPLKNFGSLLFANEFLTDEEKVIVFLSSFNAFSIMNERDILASMSEKSDASIESFLKSFNYLKGFYDLSERPEFSEEDLGFVLERSLRLGRYFIKNLKVKGDSNCTTLYTELFEVTLNFIGGRISCVYNPIIYKDCLSNRERVRYLLLKGLSLVDDDKFDYYIEQGKSYIESGYFNYITDIKETDEYLDMTCIQIDAEDKLYLLSCGVLTHNTTALVFKIMLDIINGEATKVVQIPNGTPVRVVDSIFVGTFLNSGAKELEERLKAEQRRYGYDVTADRINFGTLHAEFYRALVAMGVEVKIGDSTDLRNMLQSSIKAMGVERVSGSGSLTSEDFLIIESIVTYCRGRLDNQRYNHPSVKDYTNLTPTFLDTIINSYSQKKKQAKVMDFEDLQELLYKYLYVTPNKNVQDFISSRYNYIYLDEFQDTSQIQYAILKFYARGRAKCNRLSIQSEDLPQGYYTGEETRGKIVAIGDPDQTIYSWRGSDINIISQDFDRDFAPCVSILSRNYRCPENILAPIEKSIKVNSRSYDFPIQAAKTGGELYAYHFTSMKHMISQLAKDIERDMNDNMSIAILCRTNFNGVIPAIMLEMEHKYKFSISSDQMTLNSPLPRKILSMTSLFTERTTKGVQNALETFVFRGSAWKIKSLVQTLKNDDSNSKRTSIWTMDERDIAYSCPEILDFVRAVKSIILDEKGNRVQAKELEALRYIYKYMKATVYGGDSAYCESARAYIDVMLFMLDEKKFESVFEFQEEINNYNERLKGRVNAKNVKISIVTVHEFKGKERDSTYIWNDSDMVFPTSKTDIFDVAQVEEERRVHYIACTRARKRNTIYSIKGKEGMFLKEMDVSLVDPVPIHGVLNIKASDASEAYAQEQENLDKLLSEFDFDDSMPM